jgi:hypothetical protein
VPRKVDRYQVKIPKSLGIEKNIEEIPRAAKSMDEYYRWPRCRTPQVANTI